MGFIMTETYQTTVKDSVLQNKLAEKLMNFGMFLQKRKIPRWNKNPNEADEKGVVNTR